MSHQNELSILAPLVEDALYERGERVRGIRVPCRGDHRRPAAPGQVDGEDIGDLAKVL